MRLFLLVSILFLNCTTLATVLNFDRLGVEHGLTENHISFIEQDKQGFMWFGTADGLNRYDGYKFKQFRSDPDSPVSISDSYLSIGFVDNDGVLWIGTHTQGLNAYDHKNQSFTTFTSKQDNPDTLSNNHITAITTDAEGQLWIGTASGLNRYDKLQQKFTQIFYSSDKNIYHNYILSLYSDTQGTLWVGTKQGLKRWNADTNDLEQYPANPNINQEEIHAIFEDKQKRFWLGTKDSGIHRFNRNNGTSIHYRNEPGNSNSLSNNKVNVINQDTLNRLWIGTDNGLNLMHSDGQFSRFNHDGSDPGSISHDVILSIKTSQSGLIWVGTFGGGVNKLDTRKRHFGHVKNIPSIGDSLSHNIVMAIHQDDNGQLWLGTEGGGLIRQQAPTAGFQAFQHDPQNPYSIKDDRVRAIVRDKEGTLWIATLNGLNYLPPGEEHQTEFKFKAFSHNPLREDSLSHDQVSVLYVDRQNTLWVGTWGGGLNRFNADKGTFERFKYDPDDPSSLSHNVVVTIFEDSRNRLWIGTLGGGVNLLDRHSKRFKRFLHNADDSGSISSNTMIHVMEARNGQVWLGTYAGLNRFDEQTERFQRYRKKDGLANEVVYSVVEDNKRNLWLSTNEGLTRFNPDSLAIKNYTVDDGLQSQEFNSGAFFKNNLGEIFFGGINGYNHFDPVDIEPDTSDFNLSFTDFLLLNQAVKITSGNKEKAFTLPSSIDQLSTLKLSHRLNLISFEFAALNYRNTQQNQYQYKLEGLDDNWIDADPKIRRATYTNLPPGDYILRVKSSNADSHPSKELTLQVIVTPPWYQTWIARVIFTIMFIAAIYGLFVYRTKSLIQRAAELEQGVAQRTATINQLMQQKERMFTNISHEFKTPLTLILAPIESISTKLSQSELDHKLSMMKRNGQRLLRMVDQLLELAKLETPQTEKNFYYSLKETLDRITYAFEPLFIKKQIKLTQSEFDDVIFKMTKNSLEMILNNLISNALKYTPKGGEIEISIIHSQSVAQIAIKDSGIGISEANQKIVFNRFTRANERHDENIPGAGIGLALVKELVEVNKGQISLRSELSRGSTFSVTLPIAKEQSISLHELKSSPQAMITELEPLAQSLEEISKVVEHTNNHESKPCILLVDDNTDMLELLQQILSDEYQCILSINGEDGLYKANAHIPDLIISDLMMPGISGFEVLKNLKSDSVTCHIPVVLLTAKGDLQSRLTGWAENADEYLEKPFNPEELKARIANLLSIRNLLQQRYQTQFIEGHAISEPIPQEHDIGLEGVNQHFFQQVNTILEQYYNDDNLDVAFMAEQLSMSQRQLNRKMKSLFDLTPNESIRSFRLKKAAEKLLQGTSPSSVYHQVGFQSHSYFSQCFKARYNCIPRDYSRSGKQHH